MDLCLQENIKRGNFAKSNQLGLTIQDPTEDQILCISIIVAYLYEHQ